MTLEQKRRLEKKLEVLAQGPYSLLTAPSPQPGLYKYPVGEPPGFAIPKVPDVDPGENIVAGEGVYASAQLSPQTKTELNLWARQCGIPEKYLEDRAEYHITTVYSKEPFSGYRPLQLHKPKTVGKGKRKVERFGDAVVVTFSSPTLHKQWEQARAKGASWDFPSYRPHITIAKEVPPKFIVEKIPPYTGVIEIVSEKVEPLNESKGDDGDKEEKEESMLLNAAKKLKALAAQIEAGDERELQAEAANREQIHQGIRKLRGELSKGKKKFGDPKLLKQMADSIRAKPKVEGEDKSCKEEAARGPNGMRIRPTKRKKTPPKTKAADARKVAGLGKDTKKKKLADAINAAHKEGRVGKRFPSKRGLKRNVWRYDDSGPYRGTAPSSDYDEKEAKKAWKAKRKKKIVRKPKINIAKRFADKASRAAKEEALINAAIVGGALKAKRALGGKPKPEKKNYPNPGQGRVVTHPKHGRGFVQDHMAGGKSKVSFDKDVKGAALRSHRVVDTKDLTYKSLAASKVSDKEVISKKAALEYTKSILAKVDFKYSKVQYDRAMDAISWKMNEPSFEHHVDTYFPAGFKEGRIRSDYAAAAYTPKPITIDGKQAYAVMMFGWEDETDDYQDVTDEDEVPVKIIYGGICFVKTLDQANLFKSRNMYDIASFEETAAKKKGAMIRTKVKDDSGANDDHESVGKQIKAAGWRVLKEYKPTKDAGGSYVVQHPHAKHPNEAVHLHTGMPYGVGVVAKKDYKVKRKAKGRFIPSHRVSALLNSWGKVYDKNGTIMESADDEETATSINRGSAAQGVKHKHVTHEKNGVKHWAVVDTKDLNYGENY